MSESTKTPSGGRKWSTALRVAGALAALALLWRAFGDVDLAAVSELVGRVGLALVLVPLPYLAAMSLETLGWQLVFHQLGRRTRFLSLLYVRLSTEAVAQSLPGGMLWGESLQPWLLEKKCGVPVNEAVTAMAARRFLLLASQAAYLGVIFLIGYPVLQLSSRRLLANDGLPWAVLAAAVVLAATSILMALTLARGRLAGVVFGALSRIPVPALRRRILQGRGGFAATDGSMAGYFSQPPARHRWTGALFVLGWLAESFEAFFILRLLGVELDFLTVACFEVVVVFARHLLFMVPAGLGVQDWGYLAFLRALAVPGALTVGAAFVLLKRSKELFWILIGYLLLLADRSKPLPALADGHTQERLAAPADTATKHAMGVETL